MAGEVTIPLLPCASIDEVAEFYRALGFEQTYRQLRPNPYIALRREDLHLHFSGIAGFDPEQSYGSCLVSVADTGELYEAFAAGMRAAYGKVLVAGIPRMTRPRRRKNTGNAAGFTVVDPGGNWIRIFSHAGETSLKSGADDRGTGKLAKALRNAVVLGESKGDERQAARILDATLARERETSPVVDVVEVLVYRAELAIRLDERERAAALLAQVHELSLGEADREVLADALANARELESSLR